MRRASFRYMYTSASTGTVPSGWERVTDVDLPDSHDRWPDLIRPAGSQIHDWAFDMRHVARMIYLADRRSQRKLAFDRWSRDIILKMPVAVPKLWEAATAALVQLLGILTADRWRFEFWERSDPHSVQPALRQTLASSEVLTFSGGLDSTAYAAERAIVPSEYPLLLVGFYQGQLEDQQSRIAKAIQGISRRAVHLVQLHQRPRGGPLDPTQRTRGLLYMAGAVYAAAGHGVKVVNVPENGPMAINLPLTESRPAACSTRSVHPATLHLLNAVLATVGGTVQVVNPYQDQTKGDVCQRALGAGLSAQTLWETVSCGHSLRHNLTHCGHCYPCLVRRAGLHAAVGRDETRYLRHQLSNINVDSRDRSADGLRAIAMRARRFPAFTDLVADLPLPDAYAVDEALDVVRRGHEELTAYLRLARPDLFAQA